MLAETDQSSEMTDPGESELKVILPDHLKSFFGEQGYSPTTAEEQRSRARLRVRCATEIRFIHNPPALDTDGPLRSSQVERALVKDLSRGGIGILYHEQIFPNEKFEIDLQGRVITAVAVRCKKISPSCFETGAKILATKSDSTSDTDESSSG